MKKSQLTIFIVMIIVVVIAFTVVRCASTRVVGIRAEKGAQKTISSGLDLLPLETYGDECTGMLARQEMENIYSITHIFTQSSDIKGEIASRIRETLNSEFGACYLIPYYKKMGYNVSIIRSTEQKIAVNSKDITVISGFHILAKYKNQTGVLENFYAKSKDPLPNLINVAQQIVDFAAAAPPSSVINLNQLCSSLASGSSVNISTSQPNIFNVTDLGTNRSLVFRIDGIANIASHCRLLP